MAVVEIIDGLIKLIKENIIAKTNLIQDVVTGDITIHVYNSFHFNDGEEIVLIDSNYNVEGSPHYHIFEYAKIKTVDDTRTITLQSPIISNWLLSDKAFIQKTIGHSPLYDDRVYYGDREVIPSEDMAVTVEPVSLSNEWIYLQGGLSEEYRVSLIIYGKDIETEEGMRILNKYADAMEKLLVKSVHMDIDNYNTPLVSNVAAGSTTVVVQDTTENRTKFVPIQSHIYEIQDNNHVEIDLMITSVLTPGDGNMYISVSITTPPLYGTKPLQHSYNINEFAVFRRHGRYLYDSRADNAEYGTVQKGSAFIRAARLNWFGKEVIEYGFPQKSLAVNEDVYDSSTSSES